MRVASSRNEESAKLKNYNLEPFRLTKLLIPGAKEWLSKQKERVSTRFAVLGWKVASSLAFLGL